MVKTDYCARCRHLIVIQNQLDSKMHFFCKNKGREITSDDISDCKDFIYQERTELIGQIRKDFELLYNIISNK